MKKSFDAVGWMRKRRTEIDKEDQGLSWEEKMGKTRKLLENDPLWHRLRDRLVEPSSMPVGRAKRRKERFGEKHPD